MATSGTTDFNPNNLEVIEAAFDLAGVEARTGNDFKSAIRSLNILHQEWSNQGLNLWTIEEATIAITPGTSTYALPVDTIDVIDHNLRYGTGSSQVDYPLTQVAWSKYALISAKTQTGRPTAIVVERLVSPQFRLWPVPDAAATFVYWRLRRIQDAGGGNNTLDMPTRFIPALITGLAIKMAINKGKLDRINLLKPMYDEQLKDAKDEDRDRSSFSIRPRIR